MGRRCYYGFLCGLRKCQYVVGSVYGEVFVSRTSFFISSIFCFLGGDSFLVSGRAVPLSAPTGLTWRSAIVGETFYNIVSLALEKNIPGGPSHLSLDLPLITHHSRRLRSRHFTRLLNNDLGRALRIRNLALLLCLQHGLRNRGFALLLCLRSDFGGWC